ncbi:MAG TPA: glycosyltransferase N-terminal domain-containing protein [bacterium]
MGHFWRILYNGFGIPVLYAGLMLASLFRSKIRKGRAGRRDLFKKLESALPGLAGKNPRFWIHNSSMGEFEQAKPLIERLKETFPNGSVVVSFFSPSGYDHVQDYPNADLICYLPFDSQSNAKRFISLLEPDAAVVIRHDLWPNHIWELNKRRIPLFLANCSIRPHRLYSLPLAKQACRSVYNAFTEILAVSTEAKTFCERTHFAAGKVAVVGDTRYDQVVKRAREAENIVAPLRRLKKNRLGLVCGSTWASDEDVIIPVIDRLLKRGVRLWPVLVPHEPTPEHLTDLEDKLARRNIRAVRLSRLGSAERHDGDALLVDRVGILASLYALGEVSFVGGGFGPGVHNVLEPAALGKAIFYGPRCRNSYEAGQFEKRGVGFVVDSEEQFFDALFPLLNDPAQMARIGRAAAGLVKENVGATERIVKHIASHIGKRMKKRD